MDERNEAMRQSQHNATYGRIEQLRSELAQQRGVARLHEKIACRDIVKLRNALHQCALVLDEAHGGDYTEDEQKRLTDALKTAWLLVDEYAHVNDGSGCGCAETYPQLVPGIVSHGPGCRR